MNKRHLIPYLVLLIAVSCQNCYEQVHPAAYEVQLNQATIVSLNNAVPYYESEYVSDTVPREALAFNYTLRDTAFSFETSVLVHDADLDCDSRPNVIVDIFCIEWHNNPALAQLKIYALFDVNESKKSGDDLTQDFLVQHFHRFNDELYLNYSIDTVMSYYRTHHICSGTNVMFDLDLALQCIPTTDSVKFEFVMEFDDGTQLCQETETVYLID